MYGAMTVNNLGTLRVAREKNYTPEQLARCFHGMTQETAVGLLHGDLEMDQNGEVFPRPAPMQLHTLTLTLRGYPAGPPPVGKGMVMTNVAIPILISDRISAMIDRVRALGFDSMHYTLIDNGTDDVQREYHTTETNHVKALHNEMYQRVRYPNGNFISLTAWLTLLSQHK